MKYRTKKPKTPLRKKTNNTLILFQIVFIVFMKKKRKKITYRILGTQTTERTISVEWDLEYLSSMETVWESSSCCVIRVASKAEAEQYRTPLHSED
jgi:hypothetical protein